MGSSEGTETDPATTSATSASSLAGAASQGGRRSDDSDSPGSPAPAKSEEVARHKIRFECMAEIAYHSLLESSLDRWHRLVICLVILSGTVAFGSIQGFLPAAFQSWMTLLVVAAAVADIVFDLPASARTHRELRGRFHSIIALLETCEDPRLPSIRASMQEIYAQDPPSVRFAQAVSYNIAVDAMYPRASAKDHYETVPGRGWSPVAWFIKADTAYPTA